MRRPKRQRFLGGGRASAGWTAGFLPFAAGVPLRLFGPFRLPRRYELKKTLYKEETSFQTRLKMV
jgi:hypothetical protein